MELKLILLISLQAYLGQCWYEVTEEACAEPLTQFISTARECEAAANSLGIKWNSCCQNNNNLPYGCLKRSDNDVIWNGNANTPNQFPCTVAGNCDHGMRWAVCRIDEAGIKGYDKKDRDDMAIPVAQEKKEGKHQDTSDQAGILRLMEAVSYLDFRHEIIDRFPDVPHTNYDTEYTFIIRAEAPYTIEFMDERSAKDEYRTIYGKYPNPDRYGHTSMLTKSERDDANENPLSKNRKKVVLFAGSFHLDRSGKIAKWDCRSGHFNPFKKTPEEEWWKPKWEPLETNKNYEKVWKAAPVIADVFGFPKGEPMKCKRPNSGMVYLNDYGDDTFDDDRLFEEYDRIITDYLLSQEARDNFKRAPWTVALTGKDLIILLLMALTVVTIMAVCCECARTKGYGTTNYKVVRTVDDSDMDSEEIILQQ